VGKWRRFHHIFHHPQKNWVGAPTFFRKMWFQSGPSRGGDFEWSDDGLIFFFLSFFLFFIRAKVLMVIWTMNIMIHKETLLLKMNFMNQLSDDHFVVCLSSALR